MPQPMLDAFDSLPGIAFVPMAIEGLSAADLVRESGVSLATIHRAESVDGRTAMTFANASAILRALENAGVELIEENGGGPGARLKQHLSDQSVLRAASLAKRK